MMLPLKTTHTTAVLGAPVGWDPAKQGECIGLPCTVTT